MPERAMSDRILRRPAVEFATGLKRSSIYSEMTAGRFPLPIKLGRHAVGWIEEEILAWKRERLAERKARRQASTSEATI
jgi:prophage regulatory protein